LLRFFGHAEHPPQAAAAAGGRPIHWEPQSTDATGGPDRGKTWRFGDGMEGVEVGLVRLMFEDV